MYTVSLQLLVKRDFSKFLEELLFGTCRVRVRFLGRIAKRGSFVTLPKCYSATDALPAILKILQTNIGNTCGGLSFPYSYSWTDWTVRTL